nr:MauE/DoxX family redox-associated membrane protein [uncultured Achromobacter sp.]
MNDPVLFYGTSAALACVLLLGALEKVKDLTAFTAAVSGYDLLPARLVGVFARGYVLAEIAAGALLLIPGRQPLGAALALGVLAVATLALAINLARGHRDIDCGCSGPVAKAPGAPHGGLTGWLVLRNGALALWTLPALASLSGHARGLQWADAAAVFGLAMTAVGLYFTANHLLASHLKLRNL